VVRRNARAWLGLVEHDNDALVDEDGYAFEDVSEVQDDDETPSDQLAMGYGIQIAVVRPRNFRDAATVGEYFRQEIPVIINLEDVDNAGATRIIDFVSGLILGRCGDIERLSRRTFLIVPVGATILTTHDGLTDESFFNQALRPVNDSPFSPARGSGICHSRSSTARSATLTSMSSSGSRRPPKSPRRVRSLNHPHPGASERSFAPGSSGTGEAARPPARPPSAAAGLSWCRD
jgi:cell division inhibitor SepF